MDDFSDNPYAASHFQEDDAPQIRHIPDYLVPSILATLFCCQIFGIISIIFAALASSEKNVGNYAKALDYARYAKIFLLISVIGGGIIILMMLGSFLLPVLIGLQQ